MILNKLKSEIYCSYCNQIFQQPVLLNCGHSICAGCVPKLKNTKLSTKSNSTTEDSLSEADSGVVVCSVLNNASSATPPTIAPTVTNATPSNTTTPNVSNFQSNNILELTEPNICLVCATTKMGILEENDSMGSVDLPRNYALENLIQRITKQDKSMIGIQQQQQQQSQQTAQQYSSNQFTNCQLCENNNNNNNNGGNSFCEQCNLWYCDKCLINWHPPVGILAKHNITSTAIVTNQSANVEESTNNNITTNTTTATTDNGISSSMDNTPQCIYHPEYNYTLYCNTCGCLVCTKCLNTSADFTQTKQHCLPITNGGGYTSQHQGHTICSVVLYAKKFKSEISNRLQNLSEKVKLGAQLVQTLKQSEEQIKQSIPTVESFINQSIDQLIDQIQQKRNQLLDESQNIIQQKCKQLREQANQAGVRLTNTTSLMHFGVELMKERDPSTFVQIAPSLKNRLCTTESQFVHETEICREQHLCETKFCVNINPHLIAQIDSLKLDKFDSPPTPRMDPTQCFTEGNTIKITWDSIPSTMSMKQTRPDDYLSSSPTVTDYANQTLDFNHTRFKHQQHQPTTMLTESNSLYTFVSEQQSQLNRPLKLMPLSITADCLSSLTVGEKKLTTNINSNCNNNSINGNSNNINWNNTNGLCMNNNNNGCLIGICQSDGYNLSHHHHHQPIRYQLEMDNGRGGSFKVVYLGAERTCCLEKLNFNTVYRFRVRSTNGICQSAYSQIISLRTAKFASFVMDPYSGLASPSSPKLGLKISSNGCTISAWGETEDRVLLADLGFTDGVHYWEWVIEYYDGRGQPSFGVALPQVAKDKMLGLDEFGWSMYMNAKRTWFLHNGQHRDRTDNGINIINADHHNGVKKSIIGVRLDCDRGQLGFYLNGEPHGPVAFTNLHRKLYKIKEEQQKLEIWRKPIRFYPAISLNYFTTVCLVSGLEVPSESEESSDYSEAEYDLQSPTSLNNSKTLSNTNSHDSDEHFDSLTRLHSSIATGPVTTTTTSSSSGDGATDQSKLNTTHSLIGRSSTITCLHHSTLGTTDPSPINKLSLPYSPSFLSSPVTTSMVTSTNSVHSNNNNNQSSYHHYQHTNSPKLVTFGQK